MLKRMTLFAAHIVERRFKRNEIVSQRYQIIDHIGVGGYGNTYLVFDQVTEQKKVLKALRIHKRVTKSGKNGFEFEKKLLQSIRNPGFPAYFEDGIYNHIPFFTMEYIEGKNFDQLIFEDNRKYTEKEAFAIGYELLDPISYLHSRQIIHRDIRIPNVIMNESGIRLIDLGLARKCGQVLGDQNLRKQASPQADFYGLGHFLLFLLYSNFTFPKTNKENSWEEELELSYHARHILNRLLQIEDCYENCAQIKLDIKKNF
jgi:serine/threonine protein kinase